MGSKFVSWAEIAQMTLNCVPESTAKVIVPDANEDKEISYYNASKKDRDPAYTADRIGYHYWCVSVGDLTPFVQRVYEAGLIDEAKAGLGRDLNENLWIHDPDGNALEFVKYSSESPHMKSNKGAYTLAKSGLTGVGHVAFVVSDMEKSLDFYSETLGFEKIFSLNDDEGNPWINYLRVTDGAYIELFHGGKVRIPANDDAAAFMHLCLECDDVYKTVEELRGKNVPIDVEPSQGKDKNYQAWTHDPDGNKIELMTIDPESPQAKA